MINNRKICVVTGTRAEYGLLYWLMKEIDEDPLLELQLAVTGMHLSPEFGLTYKVIEDQGFKINEKIDMLLLSDTPVGIGKSMGLGVMGFAEAFNRLKPDIVLMLGDRYELLAAAQAALVARIPICHLHGGETTEGAFDEAIRHSITKMSHFHCVANEIYKKRVVQLGEHPDTVKIFGSVFLDNIKRLKLLSKDEFEESISFKLGKINFLVTYHPVTLSNKSTEESMNALFSAFDHFPDAKIIFTKPNADTDGRVIVKMIDDFVKRNPLKSVAHTSLGQVRYLSAIKHADVVIGNSSSGLMEVPVLKRPTVNIGDRQRGRLIADSVINCSDDKVQIISAIEKALSPDFRVVVGKAISPYGSEENVSQKIKNYLKGVSLEGILMKKFFDL